MSLIHLNDPPGTRGAGWYALSAGAEPVAPALDAPIAADVCIIGGGYTGLSAALHLAERGVAVRLLEARSLGFGASGRNGGQVGSGQRVDQATLETRHTADLAHRLWTAGEDAKALVRDLMARHAMDCDWRPGICAVSRTPRAAAGFTAQAERMARRYGYEALQPLGPAEVAAATGSEAFAGGLLDHGAGHLHPLRFAHGLACAAQAAGAMLHTDTEALAIRDGSRPRVTTARAEVLAEHVVIACNGYLGRLCPALATRVMPINNFIVATPPLQEIAPEILPGSIAACDDRFVVNYWRREPGGRLLFGGGETYGYRFPRDIRAVVRPAMEAIYPQLAGIALPQAWGGTLAISRRRLPVLLRPRRGLWAAGGYSGHGISLATLAGRVIAEAILGDASGFDLFARLPAPAFPGGARLRRPLLMLAMSWFALRDRIGG